MSIYKKEYNGLRINILPKYVERQIILEKNLTKHRRNKKRGSPAKDFPYLTLHVDLFSWDTSFMTTGCVFNDYIKKPFHPALLIWR